MTFMVFAPFKLQVKLISGWLYSLIYTASGHCFKSIFGTFQGAINVSSITCVVRFIKRFISDSYANGNVCVNVCAKRAKNSAAKK